MYIYNIKCILYLSYLYIHIDYIYIYHTRTHTHIYIYYTYRLYIYKYMYIYIYIINICRERNSLHYWKQITSSCCGRCLQTIHSSGMPGFATITKGHLDGTNSRRRFGLRSWYAQYTTIWYSIRSFFTKLGAIFRGKSWSQMGWMNWQRLSSSRHS